MGQFAYVTGFAKSGNEIHEMRFSRFLDILCSDQHSQYRKHSLSRCMTAVSKLWSFLQATKLHGARAEAHCLKDRGCLKEPSMTVLSGSRGHRTDSLRLGMCVSVQNGTRTPVFSIPINQSSIRALEPSERDREHRFCSKGRQPCHGPKYYVARRDHCMHAIVDPEADDLAQIQETLVLGGSCGFLSGF